MKEIDWHLSKMKYLRTLHYQTANKKGEKISSTGNGTIEVLKLTFDQIL